MITKGNEYSKDLLLNVFKTSVGGDVKKIIHSKEKTEENIYPVFSNGIDNKGLFLFSNTYKINEPSITISARGTIGACFYRNEKYTPVGRLISLTAKDSIKTNVKYFYYLLSKTNFIAANGAIKSLTVPMLSEVEVYTPLVQEQDKIVSILDQQQGLIDSYKEKLSLLEEQEAYYQDELLSGRLRIRLTDESINYATQQGWYLNDDLVEGKEKEFEEWIAVDFHSKVEFYKEIEFSEHVIDNSKRVKPLDWDITTLENLCNLTTGKLNANAKVENGKYRFYTCAKEHYYIDDYAFDTEAIFVSGNGSQLGHINYFNGKFNAYQRTYILKDFNFNPIYIKMYLEKYLPKRIDSEMRAANIPYLVLNVLSEMDFIIPKYKIETNFIKVFLEMFKTQKTNVQEKIKVEEEKMDYLMDELLSGRIRVK